MDRSYQPLDDAPPAYSTKPSLLDPIHLSPTTSLEPAHRRFLPEDDDATNASYDNSLTSALTLDGELPPGYTPLDESVQTFALRPPFIYAIGSSTFARYQLQADYSKSGKPFRLRIRRLLGSESRRLSLARSHEEPPSSSPRSPQKRRNSSVSYDDDMTLYAADAAHIGLFLTTTSSPSGLSIQGRGRGTLPGRIRVALDGRGGRKARITHVTQNPDSERQREEMERKMQRHGYKPADEVTETALFRVAGGKPPCEWMDEEHGLVIAIESANDSLEIVAKLDVCTRDALVTCWAAKTWASTNAAQWKMAQEAGFASGSSNTDDAPLRRASTTYT